MNYETLFNAKQTLEAAEFAVYQANYQCRETFARLDWATSPEELAAAYQAYNAALAAYDVAEATRMKAVSAYEAAKA